MFLSGLLSALYFIGPQGFDEHVSTYTNTLTAPLTHGHSKDGLPISNSFAVYEIFLFIVISGLVVCTELGCCCYLFLSSLLIDQLSSWPMAREDGGVTLQETQGLSELRESS